MKNKINNAGRKPKPVLTIGIDCGSLSPKDEKQKTGVYTIVTTLITSLCKLDKRHKYHLFSYKAISPQTIKNFDHRAKNIILPRIGYNRIWLKIALKLFRTDIFLATSQAPAAVKTPTIGFIYDLAFLKFPRLYKNHHKLNKNTGDLVSYARHIITISKSSKNDIIKTYHLEDDSVSFFYPGVEKIFTDSGTKFIDTKPYFLYVGALKKTKNIPKIIEAFSLFLKQTQKPFRLFLVGSDSDFDTDITNSIKTNNLDKDVIIKGYTQINNLPKYYRGATAFISPSLYEGFGLPILEAMSCGTPVIVGNNSSMPEVAGKSGILVNAENALDICQALTDISGNQKLQQKLKMSGLRQARKFTSDKFAKQVLRKIDDICEIK